MKNLVILLSIVLFVLGCKKNEQSSQTIEKSTYLVHVTTGPYTASHIPPKYQISGSDIATKSNVEAGSFIYSYDLPKGKMTTITVNVTEGTNRYVVLTINKKTGDKTYLNNPVFDKSADGQISATFMVE